MPELLILFQKFGISMAVGALIGMEREKGKVGSFAGVRTYPMIAFLGCASAMIQDRFSPFAFLTIFIIFSAFVLRSYILIGTQASPGITTEIASLLAFVFGALIWWDMAPFAAAAAVVVVLLLAAKEPLERLAGRIGRSDIIAAMQFGVLTLIILPVVPDRTYGPFSVLNPHTIWMMVVLVAGMNLIGYVLAKIRGERQSITITGILGGIVSSTALTLSFSRRSRVESPLSRVLAIAIAIASSIVFARVLALAFAINRAVGRQLVFPLGVLTLVGLLACGTLWLIGRQQPVPTENMQIQAANPFEIWSAIQFGILFGLIIFVSKAAQVYGSNAGVYLSSALAGFTDVDAITLSLSKLARPEPSGPSITAAVAAKGIVLAATANTALKAGIALSFGSRELRRYCLPVFLVIILTGLLLLMTR
jgi:uncharacterized membrane protein (DUF4010 family)